MEGGGWSEGANKFHEQYTETDICPYSNYLLLNLHSLATQFRAGGSKMEVARPAAKMVPYKLFMRHSCFPGAFFSHFLPLLNTVIFV